jgi:hypothetical protein
VTDSWVIYAIGALVLVLVLVWRVVTRWKVKSAKAENLRVSVSVIILGIIFAPLITWYFLW